MRWGGELGQEALCHTKVCDGRSYHSGNGHTHSEEAGKFRTAGITGVVGVCKTGSYLASSLL